MLKGIQNMINRKQAFAEAATIIFEDVTESALDNLIILGEAEEPVEEPITSEEENEENLDPSKKIDEPSDDDEGEDLLDKPVGELPAGETLPTGDTSTLIDDPDGGDDLTSAPLDDVPEPEPEVVPEELNADDDLLNVSINLATNTLNDVLPVPPANAGEAIGAEDESEDLLTSRIDSGFGDEGGEPAAPVTAPEEGDAAGLEQVDDILKEDVNTPPEKKPEDKGSAASVIMGSKMSDAEKVKAMGKLFGEGINLGGEAPAAEETTPTASAGDTPAEGEIPADPAAPEGGTGEESDVTAAVRDKVSEVDDGLGGEDYKDPKTEIMDKLDGLNRSILNAKETVKKLLQ